MTSSDKVIKQYENLPYPEFSDTELKTEEQFYKEDTITPISTYTAYTLEKTNHYMHQGRQTFWWELYLYYIILSYIIMIKPVCFE